MKTRNYRIQALAGQSLLFTLILNTLIGAELKEVKDGVDKEVSRLDADIKTAGGPSGEVQATEAQADFDPSKLPKSTFDDAFKDVTKKLIDRFNEAPKLNATLRLDNFLQMQYEIIAKQLTLLRDEVGPGERVIFLEMPQNVNASYDKASNKWPQSWWKIAGYTKLKTPVKNTRKHAVERLKATAANDGKPGDVASKIDDEKEPLTMSQVVRDAIKAFGKDGANGNSDRVDFVSLTPGDGTIKVEDRSVRTIELIPRQSSLKLGDRLQIIIDDDGAHKEPQSGETIAAKRLSKSAGAANVKRQHMGKLQHNKTIVVDGPKVQAAVCGSTNHSWRGFFVQNNNAIILRGESVVDVFMAAFNDYWENGDVTGFGKTGSATWNDLGLTDIDAKIGFSPRAQKNAVLQTIADDISSTESSLFFSLAFLYQTPGAIRDAVKKVQEDHRVFSYGISDHQVKELEDLEEPQAEGVDLLKPDGSVTVVNPAALTKENTPEPFKSEPTGGGGTRMHHKFIVIDFDKPSARVYMGSYNFSSAADRSNGENLLLIRDRRIAVSYTVEALRIFDHCEFRLAQSDAKKSQIKLQLAKPPRNNDETPWWAEVFTNVRKIRDRELFA